MATKQNLIHSLSKKITYLEEDDAALAVEAILSYLKQSLIDNQRIEVRNFGSFSLRSRKKANSQDSYRTIYYRNAQNIPAKLRVLNSL